MKGLNLSEWALKHQPLTQFLIVVVALFGIFSYRHLGQAEDPAFTFRTMMITVLWPGASTREIEQQVTDRIERKLQETPGLDHLSSYSVPGRATILVDLHDDVNPKKVPETWYQVRKKISDIQLTLPAGVVGPFYNDEFGDTFGNVYAFTADGFSYAELKDYVDAARQSMLKVPDVAKVEVLGVQDEKIYVEIAPSKIATLGIDPGLIMGALQAQNILMPSGFVNSASDRVYLRVSGDFSSVDNIRNVGISAQGRMFRLGDIAKVYRGYSDPADPAMRFNGKPALGLAISMQTGGDIIELGKNLEKQIHDIRGKMPVGVEIFKIHDQPSVVKTSISEFVRTLAEAVIIVLVVSFWSLGLRTGAVVALAIPLVLAMTFVAMDIFHIDLQKISLGALIIALGLLVDDAIIAVEMMVLKLEQGWDKFRAATFAYTSTAMPMLTGTLITVAGFLPVGLAQSAAGEYTFSMFAVVSFALIASWFVAVLFTPYLGYRILRSNAAAADAHAHDAVFDKPFYRRFRLLVEWCVRFRWAVIAATAALFLASLYAFQFVQQQFFPASTRPELVVGMWLPQGSSERATAQEVMRLEKAIGKDPDLDNMVAYIGSSSARFVLVLDQPPPAPHFAQVVLTAKTTEGRERLIERLRGLFAKQFPQVLSHVSRLPNGPPVGFPVQFRVIGDDPAVLRKYAVEVAEVMRKNPYTRDVNLNWNDMSKSMRLDIDQDKARALGVNTQNLAQSLSALLNGVPITQMREKDKLIDIVLRATRDGQTTSLGNLKDINVYTANGRYVPLSQIANIRFEMEEAGLWRRNRMPEIVARAEIPDTIQAPTVTSMINPQLDAIRARLPAGYKIEIGGAQESSSKSQASINAVMPLTLLVVTTLLMLQLQSFSRTLLVLLTAPLGVIGVAAALLIGNQPFGFVAMLGVIALAGMIMRNSVILVDQIRQDIESGLHPWNAVIESTVRRFRPIVLTAAAAVLGMIPLWRSTFYGPMAVAITGGLLVATALTLLFVPALYAAWFRVNKPT